MLTTAWLLRQVFRWFELMTSRHPKLALSLANLEVYNEAILFLRNMIKLVQTLKFGEKLDETWKPVQAGIILTTTSTLQLQEILLCEVGYDFLLTSRFSQDCLENLFSVLRERQRKPSCLQFKRHLKMITVAQYITPVSKSSYQEDDREFLGDFFENKSKELEKEEKEEEKEILRLKE